MASMNLTAFLGRAGFNTPRDFLNIEARQEVSSHPLTPGRNFTGTVFVAQHRGGVPNWVSFLSHGVADATHYRTLGALPLILGAHKANDAAYLQGCLTKRNNVEYDRVGGATKEDVSELIEFTEQLLADVLTWLQDNHPQLSPE